MVRLSGRGHCLALDILEAFRDYGRREEHGHDASKVCYWRIKDKGEVDFIYESWSEITPIKVKAQRLTKLDIPRSLINFINRYQLARAYIVNLGLKRQIKIAKTNLFYLGYSSLLVETCICSLEILSYFPGQDISVNSA